MKIRYVPKLKGNNKFETIENCCILLIFAGALVLSAGIAANIVSTGGASAILSMLGSFAVFVSTVALIVTWLVKEFSEK